MVEMMNYEVVDKEVFCGKEELKHFSEDSKYSTSMTARLDVTDLVEYSERTGTKFYINFLYLLSKVLNSKDDYRMGYLCDSDELVCYDQMNPTQYIFNDDTDTCTPVYTTYYETYELFYSEALNDLEKAAKKGGSDPDNGEHPNWFDASYISWLSYDSLNVELPEGEHSFAPSVNWGRYSKKNGRYMMPISVRLNHAIADSYVVAKVFKLLQEEISDFFVGKAA